MKQSNCFKLALLCLAFTSLQGCKGFKSVTSGSATDASSFQDDGSSATTSTTMTSTTTTSTTTTTTQPPTTTTTSTTTTTTQPPTTTTTSTTTTTTQPPTTTTTTSTTTTTTSGTPSSVSPWYFQDWNYSNAADMRSDTVIGDTYESGGAVSIIHNQMIPNPTTGQVESSSAFRVTFFGNAGAEPQVGTNIYFPMASSDRPREIWFEFYARFSDNWDTNGPFFPAPSYTSGHKFLFLFDQYETGASRWTSLVGQFESRAMQVIIAGNCADRSTCIRDYSPSFQDLFDGQWHHFKYHARMDQTNGTWEMSIDGQKVSYGIGDTDFGPNHYFNQMALSRNMNTGTSQTQTLDFGPIRVYTSNPGW